MYTTSERKCKRVLQLVLAILATSVAGCKSPSEPEANANWQYNGARISAMDIILKTSDIAAARYGKSNKVSNAARPFDLIFENDIYSITDGDKAFFEQIKEDILTDDFDSFAAAVSYPIELYFGGERRLQPKSTRIRTKAELKKYKSGIFCEGLKNAVRNQSADSLFKNWQGLMIGNGELWFDQRQNNGQSNWTYRITAINLQIQK